MFVICGALAALRGVLVGGKLSIADDSMDRFMEMQAIAACVLGGCLLAGKRNTLPGDLLGAFQLSSIHSDLVVIGVRPRWFVLLPTLIMVIAALGDRMLRQWALKR